MRTALALTPPTCWRLLHRNNIALSLPTDFIVLETPDVSVVSRLTQHPSIRNVAPQTQHSRHPSAIRLPTDIDEDGLSSGSSPFDSNSQNTDPNKPGDAGSTLHLTLHPFQAGALWQRGFTGKHVSVAVFDTGLLADHKHFPNIASQTDWTGENTTLDHVGHGSFVAGIIAGHHPACPGLAPDVQLHIFRVFTASQVSYTSWFLDAFNYALHIGIDVLNLSIGGPDFADNPFTEKIDELAAHGIIAVSAIGNDGPLWGSLNNPGDMMPVVGVGGAEPDGRVASFSSRGMTTHELDHVHQSYGRVKPDIVAYARSLIGPSHRGADRCKRLSGTSVASPVVAGAIALLASTVPLSRRKRVVTPASVKRALMVSAHRLPIASMYEQGAGLLDIEDAFEEMLRIDEEFMRVERREGAAFDYASRFLRPLSQQVSPSNSNYQQSKQTHHNIHATVVTMSMKDSERSFDKDQSRQLVNRSVTRTGVVPLSNFSEDDEDDNTPGSSPDAHLQNRRRLSSILTNRPETIPGPAAAFFPAYFDLRTTHCTHMWPHCAQPLYAGCMPIHLNVTILNPGGIEGRIEKVTWELGRNGKYLRISITPPHRFWPWTAGMGLHISAVGVPSSSRIEVEGILKLRVVSVHEKTHSDIEMPIKANVIPPPAKEKRLLWDMYHSIRYPPGYVPRDSLAETKDMLDWLGDHPHTNFHQLFREFLTAGYYIDLLTQPISCVGIDAAKKYGAILLLDSEDYFSANDTALIEDLVKDHGVSLVIAAEWYNTDVMGAIRFEDDNTRSWWSPVISGGNVPALNEILKRFEIGLGEEVFSGNVKLGPASFLFESGVAIVRFPPGGELLYVTGMRHYETGSKTTKSVVTTGGVLEMPVLGLTKAGNGAVLVYGDTNCLDTAYAGGKCYSFFVQSVTHAIRECAGTGPCKRMMRQSIVTGHGLRPGTPTLGQSARLTNEAKGLPDGLLRVFRAHSKYDLEWTCSPEDKTNCQLNTVWDDVNVCKGRTALQIHVETSKSVLGRLAVVTFPPHQHAAPVGSESKYYTEFRDLPLLRDSGGNGIGDRFSQSLRGSNGVNALSAASSGSHITRLLNEGLYRIRIRSVLLILFGICLMFTSISLRRSGHRILHNRRPSRLKNWKSRPQENRNSGGGDAGGGGGGTGGGGGSGTGGGGVLGSHVRSSNASSNASSSFLRLTCSSSGSVH